MNIAYLMRAVLFYKKRNFANALADLETISGRMPQNVVEIETLFAEIYLQQQKYSLAEKSAVRVKTLTQKNSNVLYAKTCLLLCEIYLKSNQLQRIPPLLEEAKRRTPYFHIEVAKVYLKLKKHQKAMEEYNAALVIEPNNAKALLGMAQVYSDMKNTKQALLFLEKAIKSGLHRIDEIKENPYFSHLQKTSDYQKLMQEYQNILR